MNKYFKNIIYYIIIFNIFMLLWGRFFNPIITWTQVGGVLDYKKLERKYISYDDMGDWIKKAVIASEDQNFYNHNGFDVKAIEKAIKYNKKGGKIRGGSTISQQTAKNIFLWSSRSWFRKGLETGYTFFIEKFWNKDIILERYLNSIEMGQGVFGIEAASMYYFGKSAKNLTKSEAAWIAVLLPNPKKYDPKKPTDLLKKKHNWVMNQMNNIKLNKVH